MIHYLVFVVGVGDMFLIYSDFAVRAVDVVGHFQRMLVIGGLRLHVYNVSGEPASPKDKEIFGIPLQCVWLFFVLLFTSES